MKGKGKKNNDIASLLLRGQARWGSEKMPGEIVPCLYSREHPKTGTALVNPK